MMIQEAIREMEDGNIVTRRKNIKNQDGYAIYYSRLFMLNDKIMNHPKIVNVDMDGNSKMGYLFDYSDVLADDWIVVNGE